jgi:AcrR family transcriptional regulator
VSSPGNRRTAQALETKRLIVDAARDLFVRQGYGATSVAQIAEEAGVALPTVYASVGTKPTLLRLLLDRIDEQAGVAELIAGLRVSVDAAEVLSLQVRITRRLAERCGDVIAALQSAAGVEPELGETFAAGMARHRAGARAAVERIRELGGLRPGLSPDDAAAVLAALTAPSLYASLTGEHGWSFDRCEAWLDETLAAQLLAGRGG